MLDIKAPVEKGPNITTKALVINLSGLSTTKPQLNPTHKR